jgi:hypothetical protein
MEEAIALKCVLRLALKLQTLILLFKLDLKVEWQVESSLAHLILSQQGLVASQSGGSSMIRWYS